MAMTERDRRALIILGVIAGIAIAFFLVTQVLGGGGDEEAAPTPAPVPASGAPEPEPTTASPTPTKSPKEVVNFSGRDPFSTPPELITTTPTPTSADTTSPEPTEAATTDPAKPADDQSSNVAGKQVTLTTVYTRGGTPRVTVEVDGKVYDEAVGGMFDQNYEVRSIDTTSSCATFVYGDESFRLCSDAPK